MFFNPKTISFEPFQNEECTLKEYTQEQIDEFYSLESKGYRISYNEVGEVIMIGPEPLTIEKAKLLYEHFVVELIREKYSVDDEFKVHRERYDKPEQFEEYVQYVNSCKNTAKEKYNIGDNYEQ